MNLRLHGTPADNTSVLAALALVLDIHTISRSYPDRAPSTRARIYLTVTMPRKEIH